MDVWYAAFVATAALLWNIFEWLKSGPKVYLTARSGWKISGDPKLKEKTYVLLTATNIGDRPTTINTPAFIYYRNLLSWIKACLPFIRCYADAQFIIKTPGISAKTPCILKPGEVWTGLAIQSQDLGKMIKDGLLLFALYASYSGRPKITRVRVPKPTKVHFRKEFETQDN